MIKTKNHKEAFLNFTIKETLTESRVNFEQTIVPEFEWVVMANK